MIKPKNTFKTLILFFICIIILTSSNGFTLLHTDSFTEHFNQIATLHDEDMLDTTNSHNNK